MERRLLSELKTQYRLEPELRDLWVEGSRDASIYGRAVRTLANEDVSTRSIDHLDIPVEITRKYGLGGGNSSRAIALALELDLDCFVDGFAKYAVVVDRDYNDIIDRKIESPSLIYTDGSSLEMYFFEREHIEKFAEICLHNPQYASVDRILSVFHVCRGLALIRATNEILEWGMSLPDYRRLLDVQENGKVELSMEDLVTNTLRSNGRAGQAFEFDDKLQRLNQAAGENSTRFIRGHDAVSVYYHSISYRKKREGILFSEEAFTIALHACAEPRFLSGTEMFVLIFARLALTSRSQ